MLGMLTWLGMRGVNDFETECIEILGGYIMVYMRICMVVIKAKWIA
jgi:hypothetical protein